LCHSGTLVSQLLQLLP